MLLCCKPGDLPEICFLHLSSREDVSVQLAQFLFGELGFPFLSLKVKSRMVLTTKELVRMGFFVALALALGFALAHIPNVELIMLTIFLSGCFLGKFKGMLVGSVAMALFSFFNPLGPAVMPVAGAQVIGMGLVGFGGGVMGKRIGRVRSILAKGALLAGGGFFLTFFYDLLTNLAFALAFGLRREWYVVVVGGLTFSLVHMVSNLLIFALVGGAILRRRWGLFNN